MLSEPRLTEPRFLFFGKTSTPGHVLYQDTETGRIVCDRPGCGMAPTEVGESASPEPPSAV